MSRKVIARIQFEIDGDQTEEAFGESFSDDELMEYARETMYEDLMSLYKQGELFEVIHVELTDK